MNNKRIDAHCHLFTAKQQGKELGFYFSTIFRDFIDDITKERATKGIYEKGVIANSLKGVWKVINFTRIILSRNSESVYKKLIKAYGEDYILVPLMMDCYFAVQKSEKEKRELDTITQIDMLKIGVKSLNSEKLLMYNDTNELMKTFDESVKEIKGIIEEHKNNFQAKSIDEKDKSFAYDY